MKSLIKWSLGLLFAAVALSLQTAQAQYTFSYPTNSLTTEPATAASTLLAPYFEVDLSNPTGMNTIISVANTGDAYNVYNGGVFQNSNIDGPTAVLAHVTIWSDLAVPVFDFNLYLTGMDVQKIDMRKVISGVLPSTASAGQDPTDTLSPKGLYSQDINFASCNGTDPTDTFYPFSARLPPPASLTAAQIDHLVKALTGRPDAEESGLCSGQNIGDNFARGYVTIDTVNNCTARFPGDTGYFAPSGSGDVTDQRQLTGEIYYIDLLHSIARGGNLVHIHADPSDPLVTTSGNYTFYGGFDAWTAVDNREPLPTNFAARYLSALFITPPAPSGDPVKGGAQSHVAGWGENPDVLTPQASSSGGTSKLIVWRDPKVGQQLPFSCGSAPSWYPLGQEDLVAFDEQEHPQGIQLQVPPYTFTLANLGTPFGAATQSVLVGGSALPVTSPKGWIFIDLNTSVSAAGSNPPVDPTASQGWVQVIEQSGDKKLNMMHDGTAIDSGTQPNHQTPNN